MRKLIQIARCTKGATAIEYALIAVLVVVAVVGGVSTLGVATRDMWSMINTSMPAIQ